MRESRVKQMATVEIVRKTLDNLSELVDKQVELVTLEFRENLLGMLSGGIVLLVGMVFLFLMAISLVIGAILLVSTLMPGWLAALIFSALMFVVGVTLTMIGLLRLRINPMKRTRETIKEDLEWARRQVKSNGK